MPSALTTLQATLDELNKRLEERSQQPLPLNRFRGNIVVAGCHAAEEDEWEELAIGHNVQVLSVKPCDRCKVSAWPPCCVFCLPSAVRSQYLCGSTCLSYICNMYATSCSTPAASHTQSMFKALWTLPAWRGPCASNTAPVSLKCLTCADHCLSEGWWPVSSTRQCAPWSLIVSCVQPRASMCMQHVMLSQVQLCYCR